MTIVGLDHVFTAQTALNRIYNDTRYAVSRLDDFTDPNLIYVGKEDSAGGWQAVKLDLNSGIVITYASIINNPSISSLDAAWNSRTSLIYGPYSQVF